jgi:hypothetical protein
MSKTFSLDTNPFFMVRAGFATTRAEIAELVEDAIIGRDEDETALADAQQQLVSPNQRLSAEVSYLPELSDAQTTITLRSIEDDSILESWPDVVHFPELARANILAHVAASAPADLEMIFALMDAWRDFEPDDIFTFLHGSRSRAGFPPPDSAMLDAALADLRKRHAVAATSGVMQSTYPGLLMTAVVEHYAEAGQDAPLLAVMVNEYDRATEGSLARIGAALEACAAAINSTPKNAPSEITNIPVLLAEWDDINQPVQLYEQSKGHEEGRSKKIAIMLRSVSISLANDEKDYASALVIVEALLETFPELASLAEQLKADITALGKIKVEHESAKELSGLVKAFEVASKNIMSFGNIMSQGVSSSSSRPLGPFVDEFNKLHARKDFSEVCWNLVRTLGLALNNDAKNSWASWFFIDSMMSKFGSSLSTEMRTQLTADKTTAFNNWKFNELKKEKRSGKSIALIDEMLPVATGKEKVELERMRRRMAVQRTWGWTKAVAVLAVLGGGIGSVVFDGVSANSGRTHSSATASAATSGSSSTQNGRSSASSTPTNFGASAGIKSILETPPTAGLTRAFSRAEIRYCAYQGERINYLRPMIDNYSGYQIDRFNALIDDHNARCGNYTYYEVDNAAVQREVFGKAATFRFDANRIFESW